MPADWAPHLLECLPGGPGPRPPSCLLLVWAVLDRASKGWRGLTMTPKALRRLQDLRHQLLTQPPGHKGNEEVIAKTVTAARNIPRKSLRPEPLHRS